MQKDQAGNREQTDAVTDLVRKLGDTGAAAMGSLQSATGSMSGAEKDLGQRHAGPASGEQASAIESLKMAQSQLDAELAKILDRLRVDVKRRVVEDMSLMLEKQIAVRESTVVLGARGAQGGGRQVLASIIALSSSESRIVNVADELLALVEETEFGIALPAALTMVRDAMVGVKDSLIAADAEWLSKSWPRRTRDRGRSQGSAAGNAANAVVEEFAGCRGRKPGARTRAQSLDRGIEDDPHGAGPRQSYDDPDRRAAGQPRCKR